ncbi:MAG: AAA family ATPase [Acidobacteriota bacterium]
MKSVLIGVFWAIDQGTAPVLIEEPELMLHREVIRQLPRLFARAGQRTGRQILVSTHAEEILADRGIDPFEIVVLDPSESDTKVFLGSERPELIAAAKAGVKLGPLVTSLTKPQKIEQLSLPGSAARLWA